MLNNPETGQPTYCWNSGLSAEYTDGPVVVGLMSIVSTRSYRAFGLTVIAEIELPELSPAERTSQEKADVVVKRGTVNRPTGIDSETTFHYESSEEYLLLYPAADVLIKDGRQIVVDPAQKTPAEVIRHLVLGPAFNYLLHQRNVLVLHASVVAIDGTAVAFVGDSGQGKTTTASAFLRDGHRVLSDDVAAITFESGSPAVRSGYPSIKLDPALVAQFDLDVEEPSQICPNRDRHFYGLRHDQPSEPIPLERVYLLQDGDALEIASIPSQEQLMELIRNTYIVAILGGEGEASANFSQCATLKRTTDVRKLHRPRNLDVLSDVVEAVTADIK